jgi:hypothetical protein
VDERETSTHAHDEVGVVCQTRGVAMSENKDVVVIAPRLLVAELVVGLRCGGSSAPAHSTRTRYPTARLLRQAQVRNLRGMEALTSRKMVGYLIG